MTALLHHMTTNSINKIPVIAIIGRPNVGKSTLFNRLIGKKYAVTAKEAGTTRDRLFHNFEYDGFTTVLVDTGGMEYDKKENIEADVQSQAKMAIEEADIILFVLDGTEELTVNDFTVANLLRKSEKETILITNKCDPASLKTDKYHYFELGFGEAMEISAIHNTGIGNLKEEIIKKLKKLKFSKITKEKNDAVCDICVLGKPNAGKSSLINALLGSDKIIVSDIPGTTRDTTDTDVTYNDIKYNLIDTAGLRRRGKIQQGVEKFSSLRCLSAIERSDIVILLIDGTQKVSSQDCHIAQYALEQEKGLVIAINKIDLFKEEEKEEIIWRLQQKFAFVPWAPVIFISSKTKKNIYEIFTLANQILEERKKRISTPELNRFLQKITIKHPPSSTKIKKPKFMYGNQVEINPPKFVLFLKNADNLHFSYIRYLENEIRKEYGFNGTAINLKLKNQISKKWQK